MEWNASFWSPMARQNHARIIGTNTATRARAPWSVIVSGLRHWMKTIVLACALAAGTAHPSALRAQAVAEEIKPPFGLQWGESSERLEKLLAGAKAHVVEKRQIEGRDAW